MENLIIIGSGPAAFTAAIYAARANLNPLVLEGELSDTMLPGGQLMTTTEIENFPGFPQGIDGSQLVDNMRIQATRFGAIVKSETVLSVNLDHSPEARSHEVISNNQKYLTKSIIIATGANSQRLSFKGWKSVV